MKITNYPTETRKILRKIALTAYPDYTGRKINVQSVKTITMIDNYWDGGTRIYYVFLRSDGKSFCLPADNPYRDNLEKKIDLPENVVCVTHDYFCGHDCGINIYFNNQDFQQILIAA